MAYITGTAATFADVKTAVENACTANGWTLSSGILSKNACFIKLVATAGELSIAGGTGQSGSSLTGVPDGPYKEAKMVSPNVDPISFPVNYEIHLFTDPDEVYCVINYNSDFYQQLSFGKSNIPGIGGTGCWFTGCFGASATASNTTSYRQKTFLNASETSLGFGGYVAKANMCGLFADNGPSVTTSFIHCGLDSVEWLDAYSITNSAGSRQGPEYCASLINALPNLSNQATILLPIKCVKPRTSSGRTIVASLNNARYTRIDNIVPGEIITFGADQWKIYPFLRKDATVRNGIGWPSGATHSGTFGYAIKYTGT